MHLIVTENLTKEFPVRGPGLVGLWTPPRKLAAVRDLTLSLAPGEILGLVGPNGAGKTTLIKMLCTLLLPTAGRATLAGYDVVRDGPRVREVVGLWAEELGFYGRLTPRQNLRFFAALHRLGGRQAESRTAEVLETAGIQGIGDRPFQSLSAGQKQLVGLARALLGNPRLLLLDEPTRSLDPAAVERCHGVLRRFAAEDKGGILMATHRLEEASRLCHRIALLVEGRLAWIGPPGDPSLRARLSAAGLQGMDAGGAVGLPSSDLDAAFRGAAETRSGVAAQEDGA